jgi:extradiol dioxygenase family protein
MVMKAWLDHIVLNVRDMDKALKFYVEVIGLVPERLDEYRAGKVLFPSVRINADTLIDLLAPELWASEMAGTEALPASVPNVNHFCITIEKADWESLEWRLREHSVEIDSGPMTLWGAHGDATAYYIYDWDGNQVEIRYYERG